MLRHYLTTALRNFARHKVATAISVFGLTLGLVCLIVSFGTAYVQTHGDQFFAKADRIYFIQQEVSFPAQAQLGSLKTAQTSWLLAEHLAADVPELEAVARFHTGTEESGVTSAGNSIFTRVSFADPAFLRVFNLPFAAGDAEHALDQPRSAVLMATTAQQLFGTTDVVGRPLTLRGIDLTVTGVIAKIPQPSHLAMSRMGIQFLVSLDVEEELVRRDGSRIHQEWTNSNYLTYAVLPDSGALTVEAFSRRLAALGARVILPEQGKLTFTALPVGRVHDALLSVMTSMAQTDLSINVLGTILSLLIAATACLNYANLVAAQIVGRMKEIGLRQVLGAQRGQLFLQLLLETGVQVLAACVSALLLLGLAYPVITDIAGFNVFGYFVAQPSAWLFLLVSSVVLTLVAGVYPALTVLRVTPDFVIRTDKAARGRHIGTRILVGAQFTAVSLLLILAIVIVEENRALKQAGLQAVEDPVIVVSNKMAESGVTVDILRDELSGGRGIKGITAMGSEPWSFSFQTRTLQRSAEPNGTRVNINWHEVGDGFFEAMDVKLLAGRVPSAAHTEDAWQRGNDTQAVRSLVIDRELATMLGWTPAEAAGQLIYMPIGPDKPPNPTRVVGVVENKAFKLISPMSTASAYIYFPQAADRLLIRLNKRDVAAGVAAIDAAWARLAPTAPLKRRFTDDLFTETFQVVTTISTAIFALAAFAFAIGASGLVGMATYAVTRLRREIAIRKTLGSTVRRALGLVLWDFSKPMVIANVFAWPLAFLAAQVYLSLFITRIPLTPVPFVLGFLIVLAMTWAAVGWQAWRAARVNPAEVLHYE